MAQPFTRTTAQILANRNAASLAVSHNENIVSDAVFTLVNNNLSAVWDAGGLQTQNEREETISAMVETFANMGTTNRRNWKLINVTLPNGAAGPIAVTAHVAFVEPIVAAGCTLRQYMARWANLASSILATRGGNPELLRAYQYPAGYDKYCFDFNHGLTGLDNETRSVIDHGRRLALRHATDDQLLSTAAEYHGGQLAGRFPPLGPES